MSVKAAEKTENGFIYTGKSVAQVIKKLPAVMVSRPVLTQEQIYSDARKFGSTVPLSIQHFLSGSVADVKDVVKKQLTADLDWLAAPKTTFVLEATKSTALIHTKYTRENITLDYYINLWRSKGDDGTEIYYFAIAERNW
jgi:hypothetical protein